MIGTKNIVLKERRTKTQKIKNKGTKIKTIYIYRN